MERNNNFQQESIKEWTDCQLVNIIESCAKELKIWWNHPNAQWFKDQITICAIELSKRKGEERRKEKANPLTKR